MRQCAWSYLDGAAVNQKTVQFLEGFSSAFSITERYVGNASALRVGAVDEINSLDGTNCLNKVFLFRTRVS